MRICDTRMLVIPVSIGKSRLVSCLWGAYTSGNDKDVAQSIWLVIKDMVNELIRVLAYPKLKPSKDEQNLLLADFLPYAETVVFEQVPDNLPVIRDKADQKFLIFAVVGRAEALVMDDADIFEVKPDFHTPPIMTLAECKEWLESMEI